MPSASTILSSPLSNSCSACVTASVVSPAAARPSAHTVSTSVQGTISGWYLAASRLAAADAARAAASWPLVGREPQGDPGQDSLPHDSAGPRSISCCSGALLLVPTTTAGRQCICNPFMSVPSGRRSQRTWHTSMHPMRKVGCMPLIAAGINT